jgi:hypothetical protein
LDLDGPAAGPDPGQAGQAPVGRRPGQHRRPRNPRQQAGGAPAGDPIADQPAAGGADQQPRPRRPALLQQLGLGLPPALLRLFPCAGRQVTGLLLDLQPILDPGHAGEVGHHPAHLISLLAQDRAGQGHDPIADLHPDRARVAREVGKLGSHPVGKRLPGGRDGLESPSALGDQPHTAVA